MKEGVLKKTFFRAFFLLKYLKTKSKRRSHSNPRLSRSWSRSKFFDFWGPWGSLGGPWGVPGGVPGGSLGGPWGFPGGSLGGPWDFPCRNNKIQIQTAISPKCNGARTHSHGRVANTCLLCLSRRTTNDAQPSLKLFSRSSAPMFNTCACIANGSGSFLCF